MKKWGIKEGSDSRKFESFFLFITSNKKYKKGPSYLLLMINVGKILLSDIHLIKTVVKLNINSVNH